MAACLNEVDMSNSFNDQDGIANNQAAQAPLIPAASSSTPPAQETKTSEGEPKGLSQEAAPRRASEDRNQVITARGTAEGLVLRIDGRVEEGDLLTAVREFLASRRSFLSGNDVAFEWIGRRPEEELVEVLSDILLQEFSVTVRASRQNRATPSATQSAATDEARSPITSSERSVRSSPEADLNKVSPFSIMDGGRGSPIKRGVSSQSSEKLSTIDRGVSLFDGIDQFEEATRGGVSANPLSWDEPDARFFYGTLRSGQKIETEHSIVIVGDVNSGAEVIAGGDVVILGTLRGIAHAGAYDESGGGRVIFSLNLKPTQLRIGLVISRGTGAEDASSTPKGGLSEVARVDGNIIVVEPYQSRTVWVRRRE